MGIRRITISSQTANHNQTLAMADQFTTAMQKILEERGYVGAKVTSAIQTAKDGAKSAVSFDIDGEYIGENELDGFLVEVINRIGGKNAEVND